MDYKITQSTFAPLAVLTLNSGEKVKIERGSMVYHNGKIELQGKTNGGVFKSLIRSAVSDESMFITEAIGIANGGEIGISPNTIGKIAAINCGDTQWVINDGCFLACDTTIDTQISRSKSIGTALLGQSGGYFNMTTSGTGTMLVNGFGDIMIHEVKHGETYVIDNGHAVAWEKSLNYNISVTSGLFGFKSGEGLAITFTGQGKVLIQSKQLENFARAIQPHIITNSQVN